MSVDEKCEHCFIWMMLNKDASRRLKEKFGCRSIPGDYLAPIDSVDGTYLVDEGCEHFYIIDDVMYCNSTDVIFSKMKGNYGHDRQG